MPQLDYLLSEHVQNKNTQLNIDLHVIAASKYKTKT